MHSNTPSGLILLAVVAVQACTASNHVFSFFILPPRNRIVGSTAGTQSLLQFGTLPLTTSCISRFFFPFFQRCHTPGKCMILPKIHTVPQLVYCLKLWRRGLVSSSNPNFQRVSLRDLPDGMYCIVANKA